MCVAFKVAVRGLLLVSLSLSGCGGGYGDQDEPYRATRAAFAYVTNASSDAVSIHDLDRDVGTLGQAKASAPSGDGPVSVAAHPSGKFLYVANFNAGEVSEFRIDPVSGALTPLRTPFRTGANRKSRFVAVHPSGRFAFVSTFLDGQGAGGVTAYAVNAQSGLLTPVGDAVPAGVSPGSLAIAPSGQFAYVVDTLIDGVWTFSIDAATGALTNLNPSEPVPAGAFPDAIAIDRTGRFAYVVNSGSNTISMFAVNAFTGSLTPAGAAVDTGLRPTSIAIDPTGRFAYVTNATDNSLSAYAIDAAVGTLRALGAAVPTGDGPRYVAIEPNGKFAYVVNVLSNDVSVHAIDPASGLPGPVGQRVAVGLSPAYLAIVTPAP